MFIKYSINQIEFEAPVSWAVNEINEGIEVADPDGKAAFNLSFLRRSRADPPRVDDACLLINSLASSSDLVAEGQITSDERDAEVRSMGRFRPKNPSIDTPLHWLLGCVVWTDRAVRASYCTDSLSADSLKQAVHVISSIARRSAT